MDIPLDICAGLEAFEKEYCDNLFGTKWYDYLYNYYKDFRKKAMMKRKAVRKSFQNKL